MSCKPGIVINMLVHSASICFALHTGFELSRMILDGQEAI